MGKKKTLPTRNETYLINLTYDGGQKKTLPTRNETYLINLTYDGGQKKDFAHPTKNHGN